MTQVKFPGKTLEKLSKKVSGKNFVKKLGKSFQETFLVVPTTFPTLLASQSNFGITFCYF